MKRVYPCFFIFILPLCSIEAQLEASGDLGEGRDIIQALRNKPPDLSENRDVRGDNIEPDSDYSNFSSIPIHNDFLNPSSPTAEDVYDHPKCWNECLSTGSENDMVCSFCPAKRPVKQEDIMLEVICDPSKAEVKYNLDQVLTWGFEDMEVEIKYVKKGSVGVLGHYLVTEFSDVVQNHFWEEGLCSDVEYEFCVEVTHNNMSSLDKPVCQVRR